MERRSKSKLVDTAFSSIELQKCSAVKNVQRSCFHPWPNHLLLLVVRNRLKVKLAFGLKQNHFVLMICCKIEKTSAAKTSHISLISKVNIGSCNTPLLLQ